MPSINSSGKFFANAVCLDKGSRAAIGFPVKASSLKAAKAFTSRSVLDLLPGWNVGRVAIRRGEKRVARYVLKRA